MKKRKVVASMMAVILALSLAGCGSSGSSGSSDSSDTKVANKDKPLCWFNRQPSNSSTGELDKDALSFNKNTYYVIGLNIIRRRLDILYRRLIIFNPIPPEESLLICFAGSNILNLSKCISDF